MNVLPSMICLASIAQWLPVNAVSPTPPGCATSELDLVFVVDTSADVTQEQISKTKSFVSRMIQPFEVSPVATRVSVVTYGSSARVLNNLDEITARLTDFDSPFGKSEILNLLSNSSPVGGGRRTGQALRLACDEVLKFKGGSNRRTVPAIIVVVSGGYSDDDIPSDLSCRSDDTADVTIVGVSTDRRGAAIFGSKHVDVSLEHRDSNLETVERTLFRLICNESVWNYSLAQQDLVFLLDRSVEIPRDGLQHIKDWIWEVSRRFSIGRNFSKVAIIEFGGSLFEVIDLTDDLEVLHEAIDEIRYYPTSLQTKNIAHALRYIGRKTFSVVANDPRHFVHRNLILITTSTGHATKEAQIAARDLILGGVNVFVVTVGVQDSSKSGFRVLSSKPDASHILVSEDYLQMFATWKTMVNWLRRHNFKKYAGSLVDLHFIVGGIGSEKERIQAADLMKRISDLFLIGHNYTQVWITTGSEVAKYAGSRKSDVFNAISRNPDFRQPIDLQESVNNVLNQESSRRKMIITIHPDILRNASVWRSVHSRGKRDAKLYSFGVTSGGLTWSHDGSVWDMCESTRTCDNRLEEDFRPAADVLVDRISEDSSEDCDVVELDLQFLFDGSSSIRDDDFALAKDWIESLISKFDVGQYTTRVGTDQYSGSPETEFHLNDFEAKPPVIQAVNQIDQKTGLTRTGAAMLYSLSSSLNPSAGARSNVPKILVVLTDGKSRDNVTQAAVQAHARTDLTTLAVGVADADAGELREIASEPKDAHVFQAENYHEMSGLKDVVGGQICKTATDSVPDAHFDAMDMIILYEDSDLLLTARFYTALYNFIMKLAAKATENYNSRVAVVKFAKEPRTVQEFTRNLTRLRQSLIDRRFESDEFRSRVNLGLALSHVQDMFQRDLDRNNTKKILVTIVSNPVTDSAVDKAVDLTEMGAKIFGISVGMASSLTFLERIVSDADYFYTIPNTPQLPKVEPSITRYIHTLPRAPPYVCKWRLNVEFIIDNTVGSDEYNFNQAIHLVAEVSKSLKLENGHSTLCIVQVIADGRAYGEKCFSGANASAEIALLNMEETLIDATNVIGLIGDISSNGASRTNVPKHVIAIMDASVAPDMDGTLVAESGAQLLSIAVGTVEIDSSEILSDMLPLKSYDELPTVSGLVIDTICQDAACPIWYYGTKKMNGYDVISSLDVPNSRGVKMTSSSGIVPTYRIVGKSRLQGQVREVFPNGFPSLPTAIVATLKMGKRALSTDVWNLFEIADGRGRTKFSVILDGGRNEIKVFRKADTQNVATFRGDAVNALFTKRWHKLEVILVDHRVHIRIDCVDIGSKLFEASLGSLPDHGMVRIGKLTTGRKSSVFELESMHIGCDVDQNMTSTRVEHCFEIKEEKRVRPTESSSRKNESTASGPDDVIERSTQECNCTPGATGPVGQKGEKGMRGSDGETGASGMKGEKGDSGGSSIGSQGPTGPRGSPGPAGPRGPPGLPAPMTPGNSAASIRNQKAYTMQASDSRITQIAQDECRSMILSEVPRIVMSILDSELSRERYQGRKGDKGSEGDVGRPGDRGYPGEPGQRGSTGLEGMRGTPGPAGPKGQKGNTGSRGVAGRGIPGSNGAQGPRGMPGRSIQGEPGSKGARGDQGVMGPPGVPGRRGTTGVNGQCDPQSCYNAALGYISQSIHGP